MATMLPDDPQGASRRVVLIDFDWHDADLLPALLHHPGIRVRLVAGEKAEDPGLRAAGLCGVPSTLELADLTREIFDLALIGEHSPRRHQVERLFTALGTPVASPQSFLNGSIAAMPVPCSAAVDGEVADRLELALPDLSAAPPASDAGGESPPAASPGEIADPADRAETRERGEGEPAGGPPDAPSRAAEEGPGAEAFKLELELAVERGLRGHPCSLLRLRFGGGSESLASLCRRLPARLRDRDRLCRPTPRDLLLLGAGSGAAHESLRRRVAGLWEEAWLESRRPGPPPPIAEERIGLTGPQDADRFLATSRGWLLGAASEARPLRGQLP